MEGLIIEDLQEIKVAEAEAEAEKIREVTEGSSGATWGIIIAFIVKGG